MSDTATAKPAASAPIILDLGKKKRSIIKQLCNGEGPLLEGVKTVSMNSRPVERLPPRHSPS